MGVTTQRASQLYFRLAIGEKLTPNEKAELKRVCCSF